jgi:hypothetical protein
MAVVMAEAAETAKKEEAEEKEEERKEMLKAKNIPAADKTDWATGNPTGAAVRAEASIGEEEMVWGEGEGPEMDVVDVEEEEDVVKGVIKIPPATYAEKRASQSAAQKSTGLGLKSADEKGKERVVPPPPLREKGVMAIVELPFRLKRRESGEDVDEDVAMRADDVDIAQLGADSYATVAKETAAISSNLGDLRRSVAGDGPDGELEPKSKLNLKLNKVHPVNDRV